MMFDFLFSSKAPRISADEVRKMTEARENFLLIDVRSPEEYAGGHIPNSLNVPLGQLGQRIARYAKSKEASIVVYCLSGGRSSQAQSILSGLGYTNVKNLGGISSWPYEVVR